MNKSFKDRLNFIKQTFSKNKNLSTNVYSRKYATNDTNKSLHKESNRNIDENNPTKANNILVDKA